MPYFDYTFDYTFELNDKIISNIKDFRQSVWPLYSDARRDAAVVDLDSLVADLDENPDLAGSLDDDVKRLVAESRATVDHATSPAARWLAYLRRTLTAGEIENRIVYLLSIQMNRLGAAALMNIDVFRYVVALQAPIITQDWVLTRCFLEARFGGDRQPTLFNRRWAFLLFYLTDTYLAAHWSEGGSRVSELDNGLGRARYRERFLTILRADEDLIDPRVLDLAAVAAEADLR